MRRLVVVCLCSVMGLAGCYSAPRPGITQNRYVAPEEAGVMSVGLDDHDYDLVAASIAQEMLTRGLPAGYVVALGPIDTSDCKYDVRVRQIQKSLQVILNKEGTLRFTAAIDAMRGGVANTEVGDSGQIYKLIEYNWNNQNPIDAEDMQKFGKLANINGILFGRVSLLERPMSGGGMEVTYRFVWELANTETGVVDIAHESKIRKQIVQ